MLADNPQFLGIDLHSRTRRRVAVVLTVTLYLLATFIGAYFFAETNPAAQYLIVFLCTILLFTASPLRPNGPVKRIDDPSSLYRGKVILTSLDSWSRHFHGDRFDALSPADQQDILHRYRVGSYLFNENDRYNPLKLDERERHERDRVSRRALQILTTLLFSFSGIAVYDTIRQRPLYDHAVTFLYFALTAQLLPTALILWNEADPRQALVPDPA